MKTTPECWKALMDGQTLTNGYCNVRLNEEDELVYGDGSPASWSFARPKDWSIYTPPKWFNNIPEHGVLCWVWDDNIERKRVGCIDKYDGQSNYKFKVNSIYLYKNATPLTKQEIDRLRDNAPEGEGK